MRRRAGVGAIERQRLEQVKYEDKGNELLENQFEQMSKQMDVFKINLEEFAMKHKNEIKKNPEFRRQFQEMCASIGVDPLASAKGFWTTILGIGDFYYELAIQIVEICLSTNHKTGGLIGLDELHMKLIKTRGLSRHHQNITKDDLIRAAEKLKCLGNGFKLIQINKHQYMIQSIPGELSMDHTAVLNLLSNNNRSYISVMYLIQQLKWDENRADKVLNQMVDQGLAWIDLQEPTEILYYFPSLFTACINSTN